MRKPIGQSGFTLVEMVVSVTVILLAVGMAMGGFLFLMKAQTRREAQSDLDIGVQKAIEQLKRDIRLSSLDEMFFYPSDAVVYQALSFPLARDDDGDGAIDLSDDGLIIWDRTLVYHVWESTPNQLRVTTFDPRDGDLTDEQRQQQIDSVVENGHGEYAPNGKNASTRTIFSNLFTWQVRPRGTVFDGYAPSVERDVSADLGTCVLSPGSHAFMFSVIGKSAGSTGYRVGLDSLIVSPCRAEREAERQLPASAYQGNSAPRSLFMSDGSWSGNYHLEFAAEETGDYFTLNMVNDRWEVSNFSATGVSHSNTVVTFDTTLYPSEYVVKLAGDEVTWTAAEQTGATNVTGTAEDFLRGSAVRVLLRGDAMIDGGVIAQDGSACKVTFRAGEGEDANLTLHEAFIAECADTLTPSPNIVVSTITPVTVDGSNQFEVPHDREVESDQVNFPIDRSKSYIVGYLVSADEQRGTACKWDETYSPTAPGSYVVSWSNVVTSAGGVFTAGVGMGLGVSTVEELGDAIDELLVAEDWSTNGYVETHHAVYAVASLYVTHAAKGAYTSQVLDTGLDRPMYTALEWHGDEPTGTDLRVKVRTGSDENMSDAWAWSNVVASTGSGMLVALPVRRFVQFQVLMDSSENGVDTPRMQDLTIAWDGEERAVDVGGVFTKGPDYGQFELLVDGKRLRTGITVDLELYNDIRGYNLAGSTRITSAVAAEIVPRNSGL